jgi:peptidoglycan/xylan/chitin deacetylase (PgdA/CDA1 family)
MKANPVSCKSAAILVFLGALLAVDAGGAARACPRDALGVSRNLALGTEGGVQVGLKTYPRTLALADREVVLTFDDGPLGGTTGKILDTLASECVKATFFLVGRNAEALPGLVRRMVAEGHTIGSHTFSHPTLAGLTQEAAQGEIDRGIAAVARAAYGATGEAPRVKFFRFPGFTDTPALVQWLSVRDIAVFGTDLWASDWVPMTPEAEISLLLQRIEKAGRGIVLMHDIKRQTAAMLPAFLRELKKRGLSVVHLVQGTGTAVTSPAPPGWRPVTGGIHPMARQAGPNRIEPKHALPKRNGAAKRTRTSTGLPTSTSS